MLFDQIKTPSQLKQFVENGPDENYYFTRKTMRFFGDTMANFGIRHHNKGTPNHFVELYRKRLTWPSCMVGTASCWKVGDASHYAVEDRQAKRELLGE